MKVVIVGGGLIGMLSAWELVQAGAQVTILEKNPHTGRESSWAGGGILSPLYAWKYPSPVNSLASWSQAYYPDLVQAIEGVSGISAEYRQSGLIITDPDEFSAANEWAAETGMPCQYLDQIELQGLAPALRDHDAGAMYFPTVGQIRNPRMLQSLRKALMILGVSFEENVEVSGFKTCSGRVAALESRTARYQADHYVIAAGAWTGRLLERLSISETIRPVRGQMLLLKGETDVLGQIILSAGRYLIPRMDGHILAGSTMENVGFDKRTTPEAAVGILEFAHELLPCSREMAVKSHWSGLRPGSTDGIPHIGAVPGYENLFLNSGHFRNGVVMGPASAKLLMNQILSFPCILDPRPYLPDSVVHATEI